MWGPGIPFVSGQGKVLLSLARTIPRSYTRSSQRLFTLFTNKKEALGYAVRFSHCLFNSITVLEKDKNKKLKTIYISLKKIYTKYFSSRLHSFPWCEFIQGTVVPSLPSGLIAIPATFFCLNLLKNVTL